MSNAAKTTVSRGIIDDAAIAARALDSARWAVVAAETAHANAAESCRRIRAARGGR